MTIKERNNHKVSFILHSIKKQGKLPSYHTLRTVLGRFEFIIKDLIDNNVISIVRESKPYESINKITGNTIKFHTKRIYKIEDKTFKYLPIESNIYTKKFVEVRSKLNKQDKLTNILLKDIENTLSKTTLNGENINTDVKYKKNRFYSNYTQFSKEDRLKLKIENESVKSIDIKASTIQLLIKSGTVDDNQLLKESQRPTFWEDISKEFDMNKDKFKKRFISFINGDYFDKKLYFRFETFFSKIQSLKKELGYKQVSRIYTELEKDLMFEVYEDCILNKIPFIPMHDEVIVKKSNANHILSLFKNYNVDVTVEESSTNTETGLKTNFNDFGGYRKAMSKKVLKTEKRKNKILELLANAPSLNN